MMNVFDVAIIGGGHAGAEAAYISSQFNLRVLLVSMPNVPIASAPCNPAVGGVGKGQVVREIDALGGLMGLAADRSAIQYRILNESKGFAVQSTRVQIDKDVYAQTVESILCKCENLEIIREKAESIEKVADFFKIQTTDSVFKSKTLVLTTGTFLSGKLHQGSKQETGGRIGQESSKGLETLLSQVKTLKKRFKTGTPPRILRDSIDFSQMTEQPSDDRALNFHWFHVEQKRTMPQVSCFLTKTNTKTMQIIRDNKEKSPMYNGQITGVGPRYCPSIEDKAFRYPDRNEHHVFVEPEGLNLDTFYPNGISTSLPQDVQESFLRTIEGLESAEIAIPGYAVEYDVVDTSYLRRSLEHKTVSGLFFAGQVNGTSGYEEAAGQGLVAGINASLLVKGQKPLIISRNDSYIGVLVEDLVTNERDEPYRLFTARSENRLYIREDNTILRMNKYRKYLSLNEEVDRYNENFERSYEILMDIIEKLKFSPSKESKEHFKKYSGISFSGGVLRFKDLVKSSRGKCAEVLSDELEHLGIIFDKRVILTAAVTISYEGYITRASNENEKVKKLDSIRLDIDRLSRSANISHECRQRILKIAPETFGQLRRIDGIRPATLNYVASLL